MTMKEKLLQMLSARCIIRREIAHTRLEAEARADSLSSLITVFGRRHLAQKVCGAVCYEVHPSRSCVLVSKN